MRNQARNNNCSAGMTVPQAGTVRIDDATVKRLLAEGLEVRRSIEKSAARMFAVSTSESSIRMR
jgi:hypothetical protein